MKLPLHGFFTNQNHPNPTEGETHQHLPGPKAGRMVSPTEAMERLKTDSKKLLMFVVVTEKNLPSLKDEEKKIRLNQVGKALTSNVQADVAYLKGGQFVCLFELSAEIYAQTRITTVRKALEDLPPLPPPLRTKAPTVTGYVVDIKKLKTEEKNAADIFATLFAAAQEDEDAPNTCRPLLI